MSEHPRDPATAKPILDWLRANGVDTKRTPRGAWVDIGADAITIDQFVYRPDGKILIGLDKQPAMTTLTVPLAVAPADEVRAALGHWSGRQSDLARARAEGREQAELDAMPAVVAMVVAIRDGKPLDFGGRTVPWWVAQVVHDGLGWRMGAKCPACGAERADWWDHGGPSELCPDCGSKEEPVFTVDPDEHDASRTDQERA